MSTASCRRTAARPSRAWLANHPDDAARVAAWRAQAEAIRARYGAVDQRAGAGAADARAGSRAAGAPGARSRPRPRWRRSSIGGVAGWMARGASAAAPSDGRDCSPPRRSSAHRLYIGEVRHPIEVKAEEDHLLPWLSRRVGTTLRAPDLGAFDLKLLGGRLLPGVSGPAALFMYEGASGERFTIYCSKAQRAREPRSATTPTTTSARVHWIEGGYGWVVSGPEDKDTAEGHRQRRLRPDRKAHARRRRRARAGQLISRRGS